MKTHISYAHVDVYLWANGARLLPFAPYQFTPCLPTLQIQATLDHFVFILSIERLHTHSGELQLEVRQEEEDEEVMTKRVGGVASG